MDIHLYKYIKYKKKFLEHKKQYGGGFSFIKCKSKDKVFKDKTLDLDVVKCYNTDKNFIISTVKNNG